MATEAESTTAERRERNAVDLDLETIELGSYLVGFGSFTAAAGAALTGGPGYLFLVAAGGAALATGLAAAGGSGGGA